jgi:exodeoxyribonuclease V alpha subunit
MLTLRVRGRAPAPADPTKTELHGQVDAVDYVFDNGDGTYMLVARLASDEVLRVVVEDRTELPAGGWFLFVGRWEEHPRHGWQFVTESFTPDLPAGASAVIAYLAQHCPGVGPATATRLVERYGDQAVRVLAEDPARVAADGLLRADQVGPAAEGLLRACDPALRDAHVELFQLFKGHGFPRKLTRRCLSLWGASAAARVRRDPFTLLVRGLPGCGFLRCDKLYMALRLPPHRLKRQALAVWHALRRHEGDTWVPLRDAEAAVQSQIAGTDPRPRRAVQLAVRSRWLAYRLDDEHQHWLAQAGNARSENALARRLRSLSVPSWPWPAVPGDRLSEHQRVELAKALQGPVGLLTGSPGTGKTYTAVEVIRGIIRAFGTGMVAVAAPTGKAAVRIGEKLQEAGISGVQPTTIHRLLQVRQGGDGGWRFAHDEDSPLSFPFVVVDESSMLDTDLAAALLRACGANTHVLFVGDQHQLPPVGHGAPLRDMLAADLPAARLTEIRRNSGLIVESCAAIKDGQKFQAISSLDKWSEVDNLVGLPAKGADALAERLTHTVDWLARQGKWDLIEDVQVLSARNATRRRLNHQLQQRLNPDGDRQHHRTFRVGDKIINLTNGFFGSAAAAPTTPARKFFSGAAAAPGTDTGVLGMLGGAGAGEGPTREYVANGDIGRVEGFRGRQMVVRLRAPDRLILVPLGRVEAEADAGEDDPQTGCSWQLAYCCTGHKYQGSECPVVVVLVESAGPVLECREWIYTALSRAKQLCVLIGEAALVARYCRNTVLPRRKTFLVELLRGELT